MRLLQRHFSSLKRFKELVEVLMYSELPGCLSKLIHSQMYSRPVCLLERRGKLAAYLFLQWPLHGQQQKPCQMRLVSRLAHVAVMCSQVLLQLILVIRCEWFLPYKLHIFTLSLGLRGGYLANFCHVSRCQIQFQLRVNEWWLISSLEHLAMCLVELRHESAILRMLVSWL